MNATVGWIIGVVVVVGGVAVYVISAPHSSDAMKDTKDNAAMMHDVSDTMMQKESTSTDDMMMKDAH